ncbi:MAG: type VII toxin-antitoxin system MntA family adenylyltransferase antitoxin [Gammaproteobacteria bacterium]
MAHIHPNLGKARQALSEYLAADPNVLFALLFGSAARGAPDPRDLDVAVMYTIPPTGWAVVEAMDELSRIAGRDVDLVLLDQAPALLRHHVLRDGSLLNERDPTGFRDFRERTMDDYEVYRYLTMGTPGQAA